MTRAVMVMMTDVSDGLEAEYNRWYNEIHLPEVLTVPGVLSGRRFRICGEGIRYMALYELESAEVVTSPAYLSWRANSASTQTWSQRFTVSQRLVYEQIYPAD
ncbi:MAG: hypothetical protein IT513_02405 [Burkholderiales bacterium]|nr:hypothetical protein [Burkholderiales bacterium]